MDVNLSGYCSGEIRKLAAAMLKVQETLQPVFKDGENLFAQARYATLHAVSLACREALLSNGIWLLQHSVPVEAGHIGLVTKLVHAESGEWQASFMMMPLPKSDPQGYGSALTYARRYALMSILGMVAEDDDGEASRVGAESDVFNTVSTFSPKQGEVRKVENKGQSLVPTNSLKQVNPQESGQRSNSTAPDSNRSKQSKNFEERTEVLNRLPSLDGVDYNFASADGGKLYVTATGNTAARKEALKTAGFRWNPDQKLWWLYADAA